ncbi:MAG: copper resistance CopC/CopD family protein [Ilumatobacteraceae bacterium]
MSRAVRRALAGALAAAAVLGLWVAPASAHAALERSVPSANSVVEQSPPAIVLDYDEDIEAPLASIGVFDADRKPVEVGAPAAGDDSTIVTASLPPLDDGLYAVVWRVTSADGHVIDGAFSFQVGTGSTGSGDDLIADVSGGGQVDAGLKWAYGIARFLALAGAIVLIGVGIWSVQGRPQLGSIGRIRAAMWIGWVALFAGALGAFGMFGAQAKGGTVSDAFSPSTWGDIAGTDTGRALLARIVLAVVLGVVLRMWAKHGATWWQLVAGSASLLTLITFSKSGHPNSLTPRLLWIAIDTAHLLAITAWVGGLTALALAGRAWLSEPEAVRPVRRYSATAFVAVPVIVATGVAQTLKLAGGLDDVTATTWGRMLLAKVMLVIVMVAIGGVSRWLLHHDGPGSLRRTVLVEAVIGIVVIGLAAGMVAQPPRPSVPAIPFNATVSSNGVLAAVSISPGGVGSNEIHVLITPPGGSITPVSGLTGRVSLPAQGIPNSPIEFTAEGANHFSGNITFPESGEWTLELIVAVTESESALIKTTVTIP